MINEDFKNMGNNTLDQNVELLCFLENMIIENHELAFTTASLLGVLIKASKHLISNYISKIFSILVTVQSILTQHNKLDLLEGSI